jgi:hypothetical protein
MDNDCTLGVQEQGLLVTILNCSGLQKRSKVWKLLWPVARSFAYVYPEILEKLTYIFPTAMKTDACSEHYVNPLFSLQWCCHCPCHKEIQIHSEIHLCTDLRVLWFVHHNLWIIDH